MRLRIFVLAALACGAVACSDYSSATPTTPDNPPAGAVIINVVGINGDRSFSPNPATVPAGQTVVWHNVDSVIHRVVLNGGGLDTGDLAPGAFSKAMTLGSAGPYHCSQHPSMIGTLVANP